MSGSGVPIWILLLLPTTPKLLLIPSHFFTMTLKRKLEVELDNEESFCVRMRGS